MQLRELYNIALTKTDEALTDEQVEAVFQISCITFFSEVKPKFEIDIADSTYEDEIAKLQDNVGSFKVTEIVTDTNRPNIVIVRVIPLDYNNFDLPIDYQGAFVEVCEYFITSQTIKNLAWFKNVGMQDVLFTLPDYQAIKEDLRRKFNSYGGSSLFLE
jgi:hypothetical protein